MNTVIEYYTRLQYGNARHFVKGEHADAIKTLTRRGTLDQNDMDALTALGFTLKKVLDPSL